MTQGSSWPRVQIPLALEASRSFWSLLAAPEGLRAWFHVSWRPALANTPGPQRVSSGWELLSQEFPGRHPSRLSLLGCPGRSGESRADSGLVKGPQRSSLPFPRPHSTSSSERLVQETRASNISRFPLGSSCAQGHHSGESPYSVTAPWPRRKRCVQSS